MNHAPIGVFDSGVGGLSVLRAIWQETPDEEVVYIADQAHVPYGMRPLEEVRHFSLEISRFLIQRGAKLIVLACNTASAAALQFLRVEFPSIPFVGMEPAVKPAAEKTLSGVVGVLATPATFQGALYASVVERFAQGVRLLQHTCPGLVGQIENGDVESEKAYTILEEALLPMLAQGADTIVLGCTHYPFIIPMIERIVGERARVIDPAPAIARQVKRVLEARQMLHPPHEGAHNAYKNTQFLTSGAPEQMQQVIEKLLNISVNVSPLRWEGTQVREG